MEVVVEEEAEVEIVVVNVAGQLNRGAPTTSNRARNVLVCRNICPHILAFFLSGAAAGRPKGRASSAETGGASRGQAWLVHPLQTATQRRRRPANTSAKKYTNISENFSKIPSCEVGSL